MLDPTIYPERTLGGWTQRSPESYGGWPRRQRMFEYVQELLADHPQCSAQAFGAPLGQGLGLDELVQQVAGVFARERSLLKWVALRGALPALAQLGLAKENSLVAATVGLRWNRAGRAFGLADRTVPAHLAHAASGLANSVADLAVDLDEIRLLAANELLEDRRWQLATFSDAMAIDHITWAAVIVNRLRAAGHLAVDAQARPSLLEAPGWYVDPLFCNVARFWDGTDWTDRVRLPPDHPRFTEVPDEFTSGI